MKLRSFSGPVLGLLAFLTPLGSVLANDYCAPEGFCTQNGGTTGGGNTAPVTVTNLSSLQSAASSGNAMVIFVSGTMGSGVGTRVVVASNKTIFGLPGATLVGGFDIKNASNVILRNMRVQGPGAIDVDGVDCITVQNSTNVWLDHLEVWDGQDGNMDIVNGSNYICVSWVKFHYTGASTNHQFCNLVGNSDSATSDRGKLKVTWLKNWWADGVKERMPRLRFGQNHVVNNLFASSGNNHCVRAGLEADLLIESNVFTGVKLPIDLYNNDFTAVTSRNNSFINCTGNTAGSGTAFTPPYSIPIEAVSGIEAEIRSKAGATLSSPNCGGAAATPTRTNTRTNTPLPPTATRTSTMTPTRTSTPIPPTLTSTRTNTPLPPTATSTRTASATSTRTPTPVPPTSTATLTSTRTSTTTSTASSSPTATRTSTASLTSTATGVPTQTRTSTATSSPSATPSSTSTASRTATMTATGTSTRTPTLVSTPTSTSTASMTASASATPTATDSFTRTETRTSTATASPTDTRTASPTGTASSTPTPTATDTLVDTPTATLTRTLTSTATATTSSTATSTSTVTLTSTESSTPSATKTLTSTPTWTATATFTVSSTATLTWTATATLTESPTATLTLSPTFTTTPTATSTLTATPTVTISFTPTVEAGTTPVIFPNPVSTGAMTLLPQAYTGVSDVTVQVYTSAFKMILQKRFPSVPSGQIVKVDLLDNWGQALADGVYYVFVTTKVSRKASTLVILR